MSPKRWILLLIFYISYLMLGASIYYHIEHNQERHSRADELKARIDINEYLLEQLANKTTATQTEILERITDYCGKPVTDYRGDEYEIPYTWTFYHALFFSFTVCSTVGYGNISPSTPLGRYIMIVYSIIGIPINGILFAGLGEYFSRMFESIYERYKDYKKSKDKHYVPPKLSLITTITIALIPGITIFMLLPSWVFSFFENWEYGNAFYYVFVTMSTIGFGDFVPTFQEDQPRKFGGWFIVYEIFVIVWFIFSLGYLVMIMTFITRGFQSQKLLKIEQRFASNFKSTQQRIWNGVTRDVGNLRKILNELYLSKVKPVYAEEEESKLIKRSASAPDLTIYRSEPAPEPRSKRAFSVHALSGLEGKPLVHASSDSQLSKIDKERSFATADNFRETTDLLAKVVSALATVKAPKDDIRPGMADMFGGYHGFSDSQILSAEMPRKRDRARSDFNLNPYLNPNQFMQNNEWTWSGDNNQIQEAFNNRHKNSNDLYRQSFGTLTPEDYEIAIDDREAIKPRAKKFSMPDGLRKLFGSRKNSSKELFANVERKLPNGSGDRKFSVVSVPEIQLHSTEPPSTYYSTVTAAEQGKFPKQISSDMPATTSPYQRFQGAPGPVSAINMARKRKDSLFMQNPALSSRRGSLFANNNRSPRFANKGVPPPRRGSLFPMSTQSRRPSLFSVASDEDREVLENTTLADLIRALEAVHTKAVFDEEEAGKGSQSPLLEMGGIFGVDEKKFSKALQASNAKGALANRRATIVGLAPPFLSSATASPLRRRRVGEVRNPQNNMNIDIPGSSANVTATSSPTQHFKRRFSVRPTALQIAPGKAPPVNTELAATAPNFPQAALAAVQQRRIAQRPSPLAQEHTGSTSPDIHTSSSNPLDVPTSRLLPTRPTTNISSSTFSPLSRIVQLTQAAQRKNSVPEKSTGTSNSRDNEGFEP